MSFNRSKTPWILEDPVDISPADFERRVHAWLSAGIGSLTEFSAEHLKPMSGAGGEYKIDVVAEFTVFEGARIKVLIECKHQKRPVERDEVIVLEGKLRDLGAHKGIIFSTSGFQKGALEFAAARGIATVNIQDGGSVYVTKSLFPPPASPSPWPSIADYVGVKLAPTEKGILFHLIDDSHLDAIREWFSKVSQQAKENEGNAYSTADQADS